MAAERKNVIKLTHTKKIGPLSEKEDEQTIAKSIQAKIKSSKSIKLTTAGDETIAKSIREKIRSSKSIKLAAQGKKRD